MNSRVTGTIVTRIIIVVTGGLSLTRVVDE